MLALNVEDGAGREDIPELESVNYNDGKFLEEDPNLVKHMNDCRDKFEEKDKEREVLPDIGQLTETNNKSNIEFTKLLKGLEQLRVLFDDCTENSFRHVNSIAQILENKKAPVGFPSLDPRKCFEKLHVLTQELSEKIQTHVKAMEKIGIELSAFKKSDELLRDLLIKSV